jgi:DNA-3-methyladenine glycosylase I
MSTYCDVAPTPNGTALSRHRVRVPPHERRRPVERLVLEINQAGLSWLTILKKREAFRKAYDGFDPEIVAGTRPGTGAPAQRPGIIRNRLRWTRPSPTHRRSSSCGSHTAVSRLAQGPSSSDEENG